ncbi:hypothetical protein BMS3Bbin10_00843 [bacterium BMS3Bbin10]|nr:hypothetical protein BMS3Bbin10_00843 [bacterium BMS3Bbin10]
MDCETGIGEAVLDLFAQTLQAFGARRDVTVKRDPVCPVNEASGLNEPGQLQILKRHQDARPECRAPAKPVRLIGEFGGDLQFRAADLQGVANFQIQPPKQQVLDRNDAGGPERGYGLPGALRHQRNAAIERIARVHRLQPHQRGAFALGGPRHGPQRRHLRDGAEPRHIGALLLIGLAVHQSQ